MHVLYCDQNFSVNATKTLPSGVSYIHMLCGAVHAWGTMQVVHMNLWVQYLTKSSQLVMESLRRLHREVAEASAKRSIASTLLELNYKRGWHTPATDFSLVRPSITGSDWTRCSVVHSQSDWYLCDVRVQNKNGNSSDLMYVIIPQSTMCC